MESYFIYYSLMLYDELFSKDLRMLHCFRYLHIDIVLSARFKGFYVCAVDVAQFIIITKRMLCLLDMCR